LLVPGAAASQYPAKPLRLIVPQGPGSSSDIISRIVALKVGDLLGQQLIVDNRPGAGGILGADIAAKAAPDGYTLMLGATPWVTMAPYTYKNLSYDPLSDLLPVSLVAISPNLLVVNPSVRATTVKELVELMRAKPDQLNMASAGVGSASHLAGALLNAMAGVSAVHVPYKGAGQSVIAVVSGEAEWTFTPMSGPLPHVRSGKLRPIAVGGAIRSPILPDVPTVAEAGLPGYNSGLWFGIMVPKGTPRPNVDRLNLAVVKAVQSQDVRDQLAAQGADPVSGTPEEYARFIREDYETIGRVVKSAGIKPE
jgi:tripartite-type tricarboxylate transporter receptor subunit TctC